MKLCLNFKEDNNESPPQLKAKIPISIFNHPFTSTTTTKITSPSSSPSDFTFSLSTNFPSGPSLRFCYTPSSTTLTPVLPFSLSLKSGLGLFGSPHDSPLIFNAHLSISKANPSSIIPSFSLHFKPQLGHFSLHKITHSSSPNPDPDSGSSSGSGSHVGVASRLDNGSASNPGLGNGSVSDGSLGWQDVKLEPCGSYGSEAKGSKFVDGTCADKVGNGVSPCRELVPGERGKGGVFGGVSVKARTVLPLTKRVVVNLKWGVNAPRLGSGCLGKKLPYLTVSKIGIERVEDEKEMKQKSVEANSVDLELLKGLCLWMRRDLEVLEEENRYLKRSLDNIRSGVSAGNVPRESKDVTKKLTPASRARMGEFEHWKGKKNDVEGNGRHESKKPVNNVTDLESELQKAIKAASS